MNKICITKSCRGFFEFSLVLRSCVGGVGFFSFLKIVNIDVKRIKKFSPKLPVYHGLFRKTRSFFKQNRRIPIKALFLPNCEQTIFLITQKTTGLNHWIQKPSIDWTSLMSWILQITNASNTFLKLHSEQKGAFGLHRWHLRLCREKQWQRRLRHYKLFVPVHCRRRSVS